MKVSSHPPGEGLVRVSRSDWAIEGSALHWGEGWDREGGQQEVLGSQLVAGLSVLFRKHWNLALLQIFLPSFKMLKGPRKPLLN